MTDSAISTISGLWFLPVIPLWGIIIAALVMVVSGIRAAARRKRGAGLRFASFVILFLAMTGPYHEQEQREARNDIALVLVDHSASQRVGKRTDQRDRAVAELRARLSKDPSLTVRVMEFGAPDLSGAAGANGKGTLLGPALVNGTAGIPEDRYAGAIIISDGQIHDTREELADYQIPRGPLHVLLNGQADSHDRRMVITNAPGYGLVGQETGIEFQVRETATKSPGDPLVDVRLMIDGRQVGSQRVPVNQDATFRFDLDHAGPSIVELVVPETDGELSAINNTGVATINGVRDRLRVLLISGQPYAGERTWRNLLKSDPAVDLVHFTILRPQEKNDYAPIQELALISFPTFELFDMKINEFDLMVFDRYMVRHILSPRYYRNIENYVLNGGSLLVVVGPEYAGSRSLYETAIGSLLPASPTGQVFEQGYYPRLGEMGRLHPVTAPLAAMVDTADAAGVVEADSPPPWGRWFRQVATTPRGGVALMQGVDEQPLIMLDRKGAGRVGLMTSDHIWLWARGFEGGGPQAELLRRMAHWLMKEPALEEELLQAEVTGESLRISRRSLGELPSHATITAPDGHTELIELTKNDAGQAVGFFPAALPGVYRVEDGTLSTLAAVGDYNPLELTDLATTPSKLQPHVTASGGGLWWLANGIPEIRRTKPNRDQKGQGWLGLRANESYIVTGVERLPLLPPWLAAGLTIAFLLGAWWREGR